LLRQILGGVPGDVGEPGIPVCEPRVEKVQRPQLDQAPGDIRETLRRTPAKWGGGWLPFSASESAALKSKAATLFSYSSAIESMKVWKGPASQSDVISQG